MKKNKLNRLLIIMIALSIIITSLAACGGEKKVEESKPESSTSQAGSEKETEPPKEEFKLVIWNPGNWQVTSGDKKKEDMTAYKFLDKFEAENPNITTELVTHPGEQYMELINAANAAKNGPDMLLLWPGLYVTKTLAPFLVPLDKYLSTDFINRTMGWIECRKDGNLDGEILGIPTSQYFYLMFYNKEMYKKAGFDETNLPKSWTELMTVFGKLKQQGILPMYIGDKDGWGDSGWGINCLLVSLIGPGIGDFTNRTKKIPGSEFEKAFELWAELGKNDYINKDFSSVALGDVATNFANGAAATILGGSWDIATIYSVMKENLGMFIVPYADGSNPNKDYTWAGPGSCNSITNYSKHIDDAVKLALFCSSEDFQVSYANEVGELPSIIDIDGSKFTLQSTRDLYKVATQIKAVNNVTPDAPAANTELAIMEPLLLSGKITPKELAEKYEALMEKELGAGK